MIIHNNLKSKGLTQKFSEQELEKAGIYFSDYELDPDDNKAYFFIKKNKNTINILKKEGLNVSASQKFIKKSR